MKSPAPFLDSKGNISAYHKDRVFVAWWKKNKGICTCGTMQEFNTLGLFRSDDEALTKMEATLLSDHELVKKYLGGRFYSVEVLNAIDPRHYFLPELDKYALDLGD